VLIFLYKHENIAVKPSRAKSDGGKNGGDKPRIKELFTSKEYLLLVLFMFLFTLAFNSASNFFPALALARGGSNSALGLAGSMTSLIEIPFLLFSRKLTNRFGPRGMMLMGACCVALRLVGFAFMQSMGGLVFAYLLVAPYVGLFNTGFIYYVYSIAPPKTETLAQTTIQAFSSGLAVMLGNFLGGYVIDSLGIDMLYNSALGVIALSLLIFVATSYWLKHRKY
jgi:PPP family 3-phenylpropionic acid transporter